MSEALAAETGSAPGGVGPPRLALAVAASIAVHAAALFAWAPPRGGAAAPAFVPSITVLLASAASAPSAPAVHSEPAHRAERSAAAARSESRGYLPPRYYLAFELDRGPEPLRSIDPEYPAGANSRMGRVALRLMIDERGAVDDVAVLRAEPEGVFERSALAAFAAARFSPGVLNGVPVKSRLEIEVEYLPPKGTPLDPLARSGTGY